MATVNLGHVKGDQGIQGVQGAGGTITAVTAEVDANVGTPSVDVTLGGTAENRTIDLSFHNMKGATGAQGSVVKTSGTFSYTSSTASDVVVGSTNLEALIKAHGNIRFFRNVGNTYINDLTYNFTGEKIWFFSFTHSESTTNDSVTVVSPGTSQYIDYEYFK